jgi:spore cortex formation protein SpoVR/YcgB (stage V sporulation)
MQLKEQRFENTAETEAESEELLLNIKKRTFQTCFQYWERRLVQLMNAESDYFKRRTSGL